MEAPLRKTKKSTRHSRLIILICLLAALLVAIAAMLLAKREQAKPYLPSEQVELTSRVIKEAQKADILSIDVTLHSEENYRLTQLNSTLWLDHAIEPIDTYMAARIFNCFMPLAASETILDDFSPYMAHLADFGLENPAVLLNVAYNDGTALTVRIGDATPENGQRYMLISGDDHLYLCSTEMITAFNFDYHLFYSVEQHQMSASRIDSINISTGDGSPVFAYRCPANAPPQNAKDNAYSFYLTHPVYYPADAEWVSPILTALENFVVGPRLAEDTEETRAQYGLQAPEYILTVHQRQGTQTETDESGAIGFATLPEKNYTFVLGQAHDDTTRYLAYNGHIHLFNTFQLSFIYNLKPLETTVRKPMDIPLSLLAELNDDGDIYKLTRAERLTENGDVATDSDGATLYDITVTKNGLPYDYASFESRYESLQSIRVSGALPSDYAPLADIQKTILMTMVTGETRLITLTPFDAMHNAVGMDGVYLYYLIKGGLTF